MHTQNRLISKKFLIPLHLFEMRSDSWGVFLKIFIKKYFFSIFFGSNDGIFHPLPSNEKSFWKQKISSRFIEPRGDVFETLLNCKVSYRNRSVTNQLPKNENILILGNRIKHISYLCIFKTDTEQHFILTIVWKKSKNNWLFNDFVIW